MSRLGIQPSQLRDTAYVDLLGAAEQVERNHAT
jgi:hypothetical protein